MKLFAPCWQAKFILISGKVLFLMMSLFKLNAWKVHASFSIPDNPVPVHKNFQSVATIFIKTME